MIDRKKEKKIKDLYREGLYEEIALYVEPYFRIYDIIREYTKLTEAEKVITAISYCKYRLNNPLEIKSWNLEKQTIFLENEMFHLGVLDQGIKELIENDNQYFKKNIDLFLNVDFFNSCSPKSIIYFYNMGYKDLIIDSVKKYTINDSYLIENLLSIDEFKNLVITKDFLLHGYNSNYEDYFYNLPSDRRECLGYYGAYVFGNNNYSENTILRYKKNLKKLFKNNFIEFDDDIYDKLINLYGKVSYNVICSTIRNTIKNRDYLDNMKLITDRFFNKRLEVVLSFSFKYPNISSKLFNMEQFDNDIISKIFSLAFVDVLEGVDSLSIDEFINKNIEDFSYDFNKNKGRQWDNISPLNFKDAVVLYRYGSEIAIIDKNGNWEEYLVKGLHYETLMDIYNSDKKGIDLLYDANSEGDIIFITEKAGLMIWLPFVMNREQKKVLLDKLNLLKEKKDVDIYLAVANPNEIGKYIYLNDGMSIDLEIAISSVNRIRVKDKIKVRKNNNY